MTSTDPADDVRAACHLLRTPLTAIVGFAEELLDETLSPLSPEQRRAVQVIARNAARMTAVTDELLRADGQSSAALKR